MRCLSVLLMLAMVALAGCAEQSDDVTAPRNEAFADIELETDAATGIILGIVVNEAIEPVPEATVQLLGTSFGTTTDEQGRFVFESVQPGVHSLEVSKLNHVEALVETEVTAGVADPPLVKVTLHRLFDQTPYSEFFTERGFLECARSGLAFSGPCLWDFTRVLMDAGAPLDGVGPCDRYGCAPQLNEMANNHHIFRSGVGPGWQSQIWEMTWSPSGTTTTEFMGLTVSHEDRTRIHRFADVTQTSPLRFQLNVGETHYSSWEDHTFGKTIPPEGLPTQIFVVNVEQQGVETEAIALQQDFEVFHTKFYYGLPPEGWSIVAGDEFPF